MLLYNAALLCLLAKFTSAGYYIIYSGSGGSGSPGSGGASDPLRYFPEDCDNYAEFTNIVRNETGPVLLDDDDYSIRGNENNTGVIDMPSANAETPLASFEAIRNTNYLMDIYDAYYNGTVTMTLEPDPNNATTAACAKFESQPIKDAYLRIGPRSRNGTDRGVYDSNDFYLAIGRSIKKGECPATANKVFFAVESSSSLTYHGTAWDLNATKSADGFNIKGSVPSRRAYFNNHYNYNVNATDPGFVKAADEGEFACPNWFSAQALTSLYAPTLSGSIDASVGNITWGFVDYYYGYKVTAVFSGKAWNKGAKLDTAGATISTTGEAKRSLPRTKGSWISENLKWIILGVALAVALGLGYCVFVCCRCVRRRKQGEAAKVPQEPAWQRY